MVFVSFVTNQCAQNQRCPFYRSRRKWFFRNERLISLCRTIDKFATRHNVPPARRQSHRTLIEAIHKQPTTADLTRLIVWSHCGQLINAVLHLVPPISVWPHLLSFALQIDMSTIESCRAATVSWLLSDLRLSGAKL